ncbi:MetQ/NlpA family ABC transporter substrate-binding protein [Paenisporosarcina sp. OV554]|uniref:MetQ/NlpA family ABC transporter substrate-binding protein n=1 Tax=Paenisporosarcina sp. OV554 TaxID=2135694 RepID=UPI000D3D889B|nr:MetQ/NlpA family ABC transporter substrate-binding protein [Paenisporosarcina sp. OV554]PUB13320.1 D-methionine transport system substrate-binding protein [Paenisporosarcina sp. OV554]
MKKIIFSIMLLVLVVALAACGGSDEETKGNVDNDNSVKLGGSAGPYSDMLKKAIKPALEEKGYKVEIVEFSDYIQPNIALDNGDIDANLFQHSIYIKNFSKENDMELTGLITVPTAPMGIYSNKYKSIEEVKDGATIAIPNDPVNAARTFLILQDHKLIELDPNAEPLTVSEKDIKTNAKNLVFQPIEAGQLPRSVDGADLAAVPGNFALAADMKLRDALILENMPDLYRNLVAVTTANKDSQLAKDLVEIVEAPEFEGIIDSEFEGFGKPEWMKNR